MNMEAKLRALAAAHPPGRHIVVATSYGMGGLGTGRSTRDRLAYARQYYHDHKEAIQAAQREKRIREKAQAARVLKRARQP